MSVRPANSAANGDELSPRQPAGGEEAQNPTELAPVALRCTNLNGESWTVNTTSGETIADVKRNLYLQMGLGDHVLLQLFCAGEVQLLAEDLLVGQLQEHTLQMIIKVSDIDPRQLFEAVTLGDSEALCSLLKAGARVDTRDDRGETLLHRAATAHDYAEALQTLVQARAELDAKDRCDRTPLHFAATFGHVEAVQALIEAKAEMEGREEDGWSPLHRAAMNGHSEALHSLLEARAMWDARDKDDWTALHWAARKGHLEVPNLINFCAVPSACEKAAQALQALVQARADVDVKEEHDNTPLHIAAEYGHVEAIRSLVEARAEVDAREWRGHSPLHLAAAKGRVEVTRMLLKAKVDVNAQRNDGLTPLKLAREDEVKQLLQKAGAKK